MKIKRPQHGTLVTKTLIKDRAGNVKHQNETSELIPTEASSGPFAMVRDVVSVRLSLDYNSAMVETGIEMPMPVRPGDLEGANAAMAKVEKLVSKRMERKSAEIRQLLRDLAGK